MSSYIVGSGLIAQGFLSSVTLQPDVCIYAAGVSNSGCRDINEFSRERERLLRTLADAKDMRAFVYFGTCSVLDEDLRDSPYVKHKLSMERLVVEHPRPLILRLPQVAGKTPNPHTLLNFLYARVSRSERFQLWRFAQRNIIDVADVVAIAEHLIANERLRSAPINVANTVNYRMTEIVSEMERALNKRAIYELVDRGSKYAIDTGTIRPLLSDAGVEFGNDYLARIIGKYYGNRS